MARKSSPNLKNYTGNTSSKYKDKLVQGIALWSMFWARMGKAMKSLLLFLSAFYFLPHRIRERGDMTKKSFILIVLMLIFSACEPLIGPLYRPQIAVPFNMNGIYRGKILYPSDYNPLTSRDWGDWIEVKIHHSGSYYNDDLIADGGTIPMSGSVKTFQLYGDKFEEYKMEGKISFVNISSGFINAYGSIEMLDDNGNGTGTFYNYKITHFEAQRLGTIVCSGFPAGVSMKSCGSNKNAFMYFNFWHTSSYYEKKTEALEKCCAN